MYTGMRTDLYATNIKKSGGYLQIFVLAQVALINTCNKILISKMHIHSITCTRQQEHGVGDVAKVIMTVRRGQHMYVTS